MCEIASLPIDPGIPALAVLANSITLRQRFNGALPPAWGRLREVSVRTLQHHPGSRCTIEITLRTTSGWHELIGKAYADDRADIYRAMRGIRHEGFGARDHYAIPQPLAYLPGLRLLLLEKVDGSLAKDVFLKGGPCQSVVAAEQCAYWLARFHAIASPRGPVFDLRSYAAALERWARRMGVLGEPIGGKARRLFDRLRSLLPTQDEIELRAGHGSYSHAQVFLARGRIVTFDWDGYDVADPCRDVARFGMALRRLALGRLGSIRALDAAAEAFLKAYVTARGSAALKRLSFYQAAICLQLAKYDVHHRVARWRDKVEAMLDEGLRILN